ncbi:MAG: 1-deoxy-D-xylulose-5-phosphate synthase [Acidobacteria bacterium]|nr:MAG: 1-deoxy-D-xylulose-5-phosphate synthase [Acidobacteriota bacterium]
MEHIYENGIRVTRETAGDEVRRVRLEEIDDPADLRDLSVEQLEDLAGQIRDFLVDLAATRGGHFASSLGTVELTLAVHYVYRTPEDRVVWDVGHQAYVHKLLTGRRDRLHTIRQYGGLSGFLKRSESPYDVFGAGHASTAPSAAFGFCTAHELLGDDERKTVAIIGDGAMTGGLAFEALNNAGSTQRDFLVILNDNAMSISPNVGAVAHYLTTLTTHPYYRRMKSDIYHVLEKLPRVGESMTEFARRLERGVKGALVPGALFQALGFHYLGPIDGHDLDELIPVLQKIRARRGEGPVLLHVLTHKGKGYDLAEKDPLKWHGVKPFDRETGRARAAAKPAAAPSWTEVFSDVMLEAAERHDRLVAITAAMAPGTGLSRFKERFPERFFDVGIAEGHGVTFACGLAAEGLRPVCAIYSTFLQRAFDMLIHDCALQKLPVIFAMDRGGLVGADGPTHHGTFDLAYMRMIPGMVVAAPRDADELADLLETALHHDGPFALRYPRDQVPAPRSRAPRVLEIGRWEIVRDGPRRVVLLAVGAMVGVAEQAADLLAGEGIGATVVNARFVKPLDLTMLGDLAREADVIVTLEEGVRCGGFGSAVQEALLDHDLGHGVRLVVRALPDRFVEHGSREQLLADVGLTAADTADAIRRALAGNRDQREA